MNTQQLLARLTYEFPDMDGERRLRELILYIANKCEDDPTFGATKLNKIVYFADFMSYELYGEPITGVAYKKLDYGPVPESMHVIQEEMVAEQDIVLKRRPLRRGGEQHRVVSLREPQLDLFKARDIALLDDVIRELWGKRAERVSDMSHGVAWKAAASKGRIPYQAALLDDDITDDDIALSQELAREYGW